MYADLMYLDHLDSSDVYVCFPVLFITLYFRYSFVFSIKLLQET